MTYTHIGMELDLVELDETKALKAVSDLLDELLTARRAMDLAQRRAAGLRKMIEAVVEMFPAAEDLLPEDLDGSDEPRPRGAEAVRRVLLADRGVYYSVPGLVTLLAQRNWLPDSASPANAVRTAAERLVDQGVIQKTRSIDDAVIYGYPGRYDGEEPF